ncbi:hypothetical protein ALP82_200199 [Pseudomonas savastanoi pv. fraxini]|nr:hypothetical protein ALP82_200199 [Pseudomonas savastanoi pv. fraxini]
MFGTNRRKGWQVVRLQKRVVRAHGFAPCLEETLSHLNYNRRRPQQPNLFCTPITVKEGAYHGYPHVSGAHPSPRRTGLCRSFGDRHRRCRNWRRQFSLAADGRTRRHAPHPHRRTHQRAGWQRAAHHPRRPFQPGRLPAADRRRSNHRPEQGSLRLQIVGF